MKKIFIINGPNLNFLGIRETGIYGNDNYDSLCSYIQEKFRDKNVKIEINRSYVSCDNRKNRSIQWNIRTSEGGKEWNNGINW